MTGAISVFAAGMLLVGVFTHHLPEGLSGGTEAGFICLIGFLFGLFLRSIPEFIPNGQNTTRPTRLKRPDIWAGIIGITLHSFIDGGIYTLAFENGVVAGVAATVPLVIHELAEGMIAYVLLSSAFSKRNAIIGTLIVAAFTTPLGALVFGLGFDRIIQEQIWIFRAFNAGLLVYLATILLLRPLVQNNSKTGIVPLILGVGVGLGLFWVGHQVSGGHNHAHIGQDSGSHEGHNH